MRQDKYSRLALEGWMNGDAQIAREGSRRHMPTYVHQCGPENSSWCMPCRVLRIASQTSLLLQQSAKQLWVCGALVCSSRLMHVGGTESYFGLVDLSGWSPIRISAVGLPSCPTHPGLSAVNIQQIVRPAGLPKVWCPVTTRSGGLGNPHAQDLFQQYVPCSCLPDSGRYCAFWDQPTKRCF